MQSFSRYDRGNLCDLRTLLKEVESHDDGLVADTFLSDQGTYATFHWPDWPDDIQESSRTRIAQLHKRHPELVPVEPSGGWDMFGGGWTADADSARIVAEAFLKYFGYRLRWVSSLRDRRGRISATCSIDGYSDNVRLDLSWKCPTAYPPTSLSGADQEPFRRSTNELFNWAGGRLQSLLTQLRDRLGRLYGDRFRGLYVFGSYAQPDAGIKLPEDSDLDVALLLSDMTNAYDEIKKFGEITNDLTSEYGLVVSVIPIREADFREGSTNFVRVISEYAIPA